MTLPLLEALHRRLDVLVHLDFESYWDKDFTLKKQTTEAYVRDPRFEVIGVGVKFGALQTVWLEEWEFRTWAARVDWSRIALCAHHAQFDGLILSHHYGVRPGMLLCTMSMGRALHGEGALEKLAPRYGVGVKGDELLKTRGKRRSDFTPAEWRAFGEYCVNDVDLMAQLLPRMVAQLPPEELWLVDMTIRMFTEPMFVADQEVLAKALQEERMKKTEILQRVGATAEVLRSKDKFAALLRALGEEPPTKIGKKGEIFAFAKTDPGMQALIEHENERIAAVAEARLTMTSNIVETRTERLIGAGKRGPVPFYLKYCGAHTHRWSGGDKMNPQNFNRGGVLRDAILAPAGHVLVVADSGQIEARTVAWLARQMDLLETFRRNDARTREYEAAFADRVRALGDVVTKEQAKQIDQDLAARGINEGDFYSDVGSGFFMKAISKKGTPLERQLSKNMVLGLGFGMGWGKFATELLKGMLSTPPVQFIREDAAKFRVDVRAFEARPFGLQKDPDNPVTCGDRVRELTARIPYEDLLVHCAVADHFVRLYRGKYARIAGLWKLMDDVLARIESDAGPETRGRYGPLTFLRHAISKPSGMVLHYPGLRRGKSGFSYMGGKGGRERVHIYGGLLTENGVQSLARDIVAEQALWVKSRGYRVATTTHDEIVCVVPESQGEECLAYMLEVMRTPPSWCAGLPLNAAGGIARNYGEAK